MLGDWTNRLKRVIGVLQRWHDVSIWMLPGPTILEEELSVWVDCFSRSNNQKRMLAPKMLTFIGIIRGIMTKSTFLYFNLQIFRCSIFFMELFDFSSVTQVTTWWSQVSCKLKWRHKTPTVSHTNQSEKDYEIRSIVESLNQTLGGFIWFLCALVLVCLGFCVPWLWCA